MITSKVYPLAIPPKSISASPSLLIKLLELSIKKQETLSMEAGDIVGEIYDALHQQYQNPDSEESLSLSSSSLISFWLKT